MTLALSSLLLWLASAAGALVAWLALCRWRPERQAAPSQPEDPREQLSCATEPVLLNVELPTLTDEEDFSLSCPQCGFTGPLDDLTIVGETVDCPLCEQPFEVLDPEPATRSS